MDFFTSTFVLKNLDSLGYTILQSLNYTLIALRKISWKNDKSPLHNIKVMKGY